MSREEYREEINLFRQFHDGEYDWGSEIDAESVADDDNPQLPQIHDAIGNDWD